MKKNIKMYLLKFLNVIPFVFLAIFLFLTIIKFFGISHSLLGIIFLFMSLSLTYSHLSKFNYLKQGVLMAVIGVLAIIASINTLSSILLNFVVLFSLIYIYSDDFTPKNHFLLGLEFLMLQIMPTSLSDIPTRIIAVFYAFIITTIFIIIKKKFQTKPKMNPMVSSAYKSILEHLNKLVNGEKDKIDVQQIYDLTSKYCLSINSNVLNQDNILNNHEKFEFRLLLYAEQMTQLLYDISKHKDKFIESDYEYFNQLSKTLAKTKTYEDLRKYLAKFIKKYNLSDEFFNQDWKLIIESLIYTLNKTEECQNYKTSILRGYRYRIDNLIKRFGFSHFTFRFALQTSIIVSICFLIANVIPMVNTYWIPLMAYTTICTYPDDTVKDAGIRILGTIAGLILFASLTHFIPDNLRVPLVLVVGFILVMCIKSTFINMVVGTQMSVAALYGSVGLTSSMLIRVTFVIIGAIVSIVGVRLIIHTKKEDVFKLKLKELIENNKSLIFELKRILKNGMRGPFISEAMMRTHLIINELKKLSEAQEHYKKEEIKSLLNYNYRFLMDVNRLGILLSKESVEDKKVKEIEKQINKLDKLLQGNIDLNDLPKNVYEIKKYSTSYIDFQIQKSNLTMSKFLKTLKPKKL